MSQTFDDCLQTFIKHVEDLNTEDTTGCNGYLREFVKLRDIQKTNKESGNFQAEAGKKSVNIKKNRFKDIIPFDASRVTLSAIDGVDDSDYINASFIKNIDGRHGYIAAQGPLPNTVDDFWRMLWEYKTEIVFMACLVQEDGKRKCEKYWPDLGKSHKYGNIMVKLESEKEIFQDFIKREITAECSGKVNHVTQFQYMGWADHGIPRAPSEIRKIIGKMRDTRLNEDIPVVIHCSAGCGRTGTLCAVDYVWNLLLFRRVSEGFSVFDIIKDIREQRQSMVQTLDQYELVHLVVKELCDQMLNDSSEAEYVNADFEEMYCNAGVINSQDDGENLYQEVDVSSSDTNKQNVVNQAEKPVIRPKPGVAPRTMFTKSDDKGPTTTSGPNVPTSNSYVNVEPKAKGTGFKTVIKNVNTSKTEVVKNTPQSDGAQKNKMADSQSSSAMTTKTNQSEAGKTKPATNGTMTSQSAAFVAANVYSKVDQSKVQQTSAGSSTTVPQDDYSAVDFNKKGTPNAANVSPPVKTPEDEAPAIPDRNYDPQEVHSPTSKPSVKNILPPPPPSSTHSGIQVRNLTPTKSQGHLGVKVINTLMGKSQGHSGLPVLNSASVKGQVKPALQTKGTDGVRIKCEGGAQHAPPATWGFSGPRIAEQSRPALTIGHSAGSVRGQHQVGFSRHQYDNVQVQGSGVQTMPAKKGIVQQLLESSRDRFANKAPPVMRYGNPEMGFPHRVGHPSGSRSLPQHWMKINPR